MAKEITIASSSDKICSFDEVLNLSKFKKEDFNSNQLKALKEFYETSDYSKTVTRDKKLLNLLYKSESIKDIAINILRYNRVGNKIDPELTKLREKQSKLFNTPIKSTQKKVKLDEKEIKQKDKEIEVKHIEVNKDKEPELSKPASFYFSVASRKNISKNTAKSDSADNDLKKKVNHFYKKYDDPTYICKFAEPTTDICIGDKGNKVKWLQSQLIRLGYKIGLTGIFDQNTEICLKDYQKSKGIKVTGILNTVTLNHIKCD